MPPFLLPFIAGAKSFFAAIFTFCSRPPGSWLAAALALALGLWWFGQHEVNVGKAICQAAAADRAASINAEQPKIVERLRTVYVPAEAKIKTVTQTIIQRVPVYVTRKDDAACTINSGFVRLHDAAAKGELPPGPTGTDAAASGVKLSAVAQTITSNYGTCHIALSRAKEWQDWYIANKTLWETGK